MKSTDSQVVDLEFSRKYDKQHAEAYHHKHRQGLLRVWSHVREEQMARRALRLAGNPQTVLDLPCGAGRFWPLLLEQPDRALIAADYSADMLTVAQSVHREIMQGRVQCLQTSAFNIDLPDSAVDNIFCMRLLHHIGRSEDRKILLEQFHRVARETVIISLWVDGNYKAWRRKRLERQRQKHRKTGGQNRFVVARRTIEEEFKASGFESLGHIDFLPLYQMWRIYVLRKC
ncbi:MAG: class I SAM-dependent methyltransferase [Desulfuromonadales bacterium]|nr:class I SAM-dependent methyltransferase [Desulfuromonadales bacterium]